MQIHKWGNKGSPTNYNLCLHFIIFALISTHPPLMQKYSTPNNSLKYTNLADGSGFVRMSATCSLVLQYVIWMLPFTTKSRMKWYRISMCLVWLWFIELFVIVIIVWLSQWIVAACFWTCWISSKILLIQTAWQAAVVATVYSTFDDNKAIHCCFFEHHETASDRWMKT